MKSTLKTISGIPRVFYITAIFFLFCGESAVGQGNNAADRIDDNVPFPQTPTDIRLANGGPGKTYWQNSADYNISVVLDDLNHTVSGSVDITYTNNSPVGLDFLWLQLDQNIYRPDSRAFLSATPSGPGIDPLLNTTSGYHISAVKVNGKVKKASEYLISDTRMKIFLNHTLKRNGGRNTIQIDYSFTIPLQGTDRMGRMKTSGGWTYQVAQWYPRMCVFDNIEGWNTTPYLGKGEFYLEYGNIRFNVTAPDGFIVTGSGSLENPAQVLSNLQRKRLKAAAASDIPVVINSGQETSDRAVSLIKGEKTWKFSCKNTRDVAWAASKCFVWDAARISLGDGKQHLAMSYYPVESAHEGGWIHSTEFVKAAVEFYSSYLTDYTYPNAVNVAGNVSGMEYPGIIFCAAGSKGKTLWDVVSHEIGHNWFPMMVGSNERKYAWMDEGLNTFINSMAERSFKNGIYADPFTSSLLARGVYSDTTQSIMTPPDFQKRNNFGNLSYYKPALGLRILREAILGSERFDIALKDYVHQWAFKHPSPYDFFRCIENSAGEDLSWFWNGWFFSTEKCDFEVKGVDEPPFRGKQVILTNLGKLPMPFEIDVTDQNGLVTRFSFPVEIWRNGNTVYLPISTKGKVAKIEIDPEGKTPDFNLSNNRWAPIAK